MLDKFKCFLLPHRLCATDSFNFSFLPFFYFFLTLKMICFFPVTLFTSYEVIQSLVMDSNRHLTLARVQVCVFMSVKFRFVGKKEQV